MLWIYVFACIHDHCNIRTVKTTANSENPQLYFICMLNQFYTWSFKLIQHGNCWRNWRMWSSRFVIVLRAVLCLSDSQCRLNDCLGRHRRNSSANMQQCEIERCWTFPGSLNQACTFPGLVSVLLCRDFSRCQSGHIWPLPRHRNRDWRVARCHHTFRFYSAEPEAVWQCDKVVLHNAMCVSLYQCLKWLLRN